MPTDSTHPDKTRCSTVRHLPYYIQVSRLLRHQPVPFPETTQKIILANKKANVGYFIMTGGCGSLELPGATAQTAVESAGFWLAFTRAMGDSEAYTLYLG